MILLLTKEELGERARELPKTEIRLHHFKSIPVYIARQVKEEKGVVYYTPWEEPEKAMSHYIELVKL